MGMQYVMCMTGIFPKRIVALIPAHQEEASIGATIDSLLAQTRPVDKIVVLADNCTDRTVEIAQTYARLLLSVDVYETVGNTGKKAGALNQGIARELGGNGGVDFFLPMDADTVLGPEFVERALREFEGPRGVKVGGVGAVFRARKGRGWLWTCQMLEWERYREQISRTGKTFVMSGTAALVRVEALEAVREKFGRWYDEENITEDSRLSLDLKLCGWELRSPVACEVATETMPSVVDLFRQRRRWYRGAIANVVDTWKGNGNGNGNGNGVWNWSVMGVYVKQQVMLAVGVSLLWLLLGMTAVAAVLGLLNPPGGFWLAVGGIFLIERVISVWDTSWRYRLFAGVLFPELVYAIILQAAYLAAVYQALRGSAGTWHHLAPLGNR